ncbi:MAG: hypothetical protein R6W73_06560 [Candidatus Saliniplasma sp.]
MQKANKLRQVIVSFLFIIILVSITQGAVSEAYSSSDFDVDVDLEDEVKVSISHDDNLLYSIDYKNFIITTEDRTYDIPLHECDWTIDKREIKDEAFPHTDIQLQTELRDGNDFIGDLNFDIDVYYSRDVSEVTFSFTLSDIEHLSGGMIDIVKDVSTTGYMIDEPELDKEYYKFYYQDGSTGLYRWNNELVFNGESSELDFWSEDERRLIIQGDFGSDIDEVSMEPVEIEKTNAGVAVPVPEPYDHLPSFVIGLMIGAGIIVGILAEKRTQFYKEKDPEKVVKLEDSYYYKGKD